MIRKDRYSQYGKPPLPWAARLAEAELKIQALEIKLQNLLDELEVKPATKKLSAVQNMIAYKRAVHDLISGDKKAVVKFKEAGGWIPVGNHK